jgi:hypothetical protein
VKIKCEVEYTPFLSLLCPWSLDGLLTGQPGLDSGQGQDVSLLHDVQTGPGAHPAFYTVSSEGSFTGDKNLNAINNFSSNKNMVTGPDGALHQE